MSAGALGNAYTPLDYDISGTTFALQYPPTNTALKLGRYFLFDVDSQWLSTA